ncbi:MAG: acetyl-CoA carboxylase biotin carboxylase subunit [Bacteroidales bacterium]|nr:acetyl-CoA carboxylase biotin carboxylase subunit [Bacteroidales bacterium]
MIKKLLIANRGEIAVRIIRTARRMGIRTVAIYSEIDKNSLHHSFADEAYCIGKSELSETYLNIPAIIHIAESSHCDALHPGYGFLSENPELVKACNEAGIIFVGPEAKVMQVMGNKVEARDFVSSIGVPVTKGVSGNTAEILSQVDEIGFPVLVKAAGGGGGKGMRIVSDKESLAGALEAASREAANYFADGTVYIEKYLEEPRHIEFQILGDNFGNVVHLFERECTIQRRYQKIIEEAPSPTLTPELRSQMGEAAVAIGKAINYSGAGTIEFLVDKELNFYFLEMNTRIQVEHPVTELTTGIDIVEEQIFIASGEKLRVNQKELHQTGHAIECRIYAEDPANNFLPSPGNLSLYQKPAGDFIRVDDAMNKPYQVSSFFDPMIAKLITHGKTREEARFHMIDALQNYGIHGIKNNISYLNAIVQNINFINNTISTRFCAELTDTLLTAIENDRKSIPELLPIAVAIVSKSPPGDSNNQVRLETENIWSNIGYWRILMQPELEMEGNIYQCQINNLSQNKLSGKINGKQAEISFEEIYSTQQIDIQINDEPYKVFVSHPEPGKVIVSYNTHVFDVIRKDILPAQTDFNIVSASVGESGSNITSPMPGKVIKIAVKQSDLVAKGDLLLVVEAMKMENNILSPADAIVDRITVSAGDLVDSITTLIHLSAPDQKQSQV